LYQMLTCHLMNLSLLSRINSFKRRSSKISIIWRYNQYEYVLVNAWKACLQAELIGIKFSCINETDVIFRPFFVLLIAARMESNGQRNCIHVSQTVADILVARGKKHWLITRLDMIEAKGKGMLSDGRKQWCFVFWLRIS
jgi:Adenylate and Guanylate cyclase catalytic domain